MFDNYLMTCTEKVRFLHFTNVKKIHIEMTVKIFFKWSQRYKPILAVFSDGAQNNLVLTTNKWKWVFVNSLLLDGLILRLSLIDMDSGMSTFPIIIVVLFHFKLTNLTLFYSPYGWTEKYCEVRKIWFLAYLTNFLSSIEENCRHVYIVFNCYNTVRVSFVSIV